MPAHRKSIEELRASGTFRPDRHRARAIGPLYPLEIAWMDREEQAAYQAARTVLKRKRSERPALEELSLFAVAWARHWRACDIFPHEELEVLRSAAWMVPAVASLSGHQANEIHSRASRTLEAPA